MTYAARRMGFKVPIQATTHVKQKYAKGDVGFG